MVNKKIDMFYREEYKKIMQRLSEESLFIQIITGPRQVGKTFLIKQLLDNYPYDFIYANADENYTNEASWIDINWQNARLKSKGKPFLLVFDEIQKVDNWSNAVKANREKDSIAENNISVILSGSSQMLIQKGLSESLTGRYELTYLTHWSYCEMKDAFDISLKDYIAFGGYPGAMKLFNDNERWASYIKNSIIESSISQDVLQMSSIHKPALLRALFYLGVNYSGQILSLNKILGQLNDAGNTTTLSSYLELLKHAGLITGLEKFTKTMIKTKSSSPKIQIFNNAFLTAVNITEINEVFENAQKWGRWVESAVGAYLINQSLKNNFEVFYWRENNNEVDFVIKKGKKVVSLEVKSSSFSKKHKGLIEFQKKYNEVKSYVIGEPGINLKMFFEMDINDFFR